MVTEKMKKHQFAKKDFLDVTEMIRSIQRSEGNLDCFGRAQGYCDQLECAWRAYCLPRPQDLPYERDLRGKTRQGKSSADDGQKTMTENQ
jgi:hypothetical protein